MQPTSSSILSYAQMLPLNLSQIIGITASTLIFVLITSKHEFINMWHIDRKITLTRILFSIITTYHWTKIYNYRNSTREEDQTLQNMRYIVKKINIINKTYDSLDLFLSFVSIYLRIFFCSIKHAATIGLINAFVFSHYFPHPLGSLTFFQEWWRKVIPLMFYQTAGRLLVPLVFSKIKLLEADVNDHKKH